ncbi:interferon alpha-inducible protein 27-like protein 2B [Eriocheir sinensis]|uniref:interferon alpha-inducible protein 27-like protein 2B n=1 Tax=Eriocheir sinensis TaxID=95602 RepID=UPI0021C8F70D|nr:interferon alpha-inducible protein 27-like protein 2B [Eriocheir sinensis]
MEAKSCPACRNPWNHEDHLPVMLPACGHSFCKNCLVMMHKHDKCSRCPTCRKEYKDIKPEDLPANFALLDLIDSSAQDGPGPNPGSPDVLPSGSPSEPPKRDSGKGIPVCAAGGAVGGLTAVAAVPAGVTAVGFTSSGITAGSLAAKMMSLSARFYGGGVPARGVVATLQSIGAVGLGVTGTAIFGVIGVAAGVLAAKVIHETYRKEEKDDEPRKGN